MQPPAHHKLLMGYQVFLLIFILAHPEHVADNLCGGTQYAQTTDAKFSHTSCAFEKALRIAVSMLQTRHLETSAVH